MFFWLVLSFREIGIILYALVKNIASSYILFEHTKAKVSTLGLFLE